MDAVRKKLLKARTGLLLEHPFFGSLCLRMNPVPDPKCATAWTDGRTLAYNPAYVAGLSEAQVKGLMAHTVMHPACQHHVRRRERDAHHWNMACDHAINWVLLDAGIILPPGYLDNPAYHGRSADDIYADLHSHGGEESRPSLTEGEGEAQGELDWDGPVGNMGEHDDPGDDSDSGTGEAGGDGDTPQGASDGETAESGSEQHGDPGGSGEVRDGQNDVEGGASDEGGTDEEWELAMAQAAQQARDMGDLPGSLERLIKEVLNPELDWQELLERFICDRARDDYSWTPPNKRFLHMNLILPSLSNRKLPEVVLAIDTSGSVTDAEMNQFGAEVSGILESFDTTVHVAYCDSTVTGSQSFGRNDLPLELTPEGGGGTDYRPVFEWVEQEGLDPACLVYLTDMECMHFPRCDPEYPVLWARVGGGGNTPPFGDMIDIH
ncbi:DUF2201 family putative metallopeptidase [Pseudodesulfovibrio senegalensis]|uniref:Metallopeptidase domain-containing protein n=1 Tax=Pseudodesulfovibrio senegalensis TaxID=1721087 RepID=A0A6N6N2M6_9BACT|nr:VWA-like domain-containing protein [Pseudodesulfovibrio senegalensis]KAB1442191.1 hypothetical protein F8A88_06930 [Pseudodesulfovibrio senegalensis]